MACDWLAPHHRSIHAAWISFAAGQSDKNQDDRPPGGSCLYGTARPGSIDDCAPCDVV